MDRQKIRREIKRKRHEEGGNAPSFKMRGIKRCGSVEGKSGWLGLHRSPSEYFGGKKNGELTGETENEIALIQPHEFF